MTNWVRVDGQVYTAWVGEYAGNADELVDFLESLIEIREQEASA